MAQAPPTFVSSKNSPVAASHLHRQIELQSNAQTPFFEAYNIAGATGNPIHFDTIVKDTFKRYDKATGIYVFPINGFWIVTAWMTGGAGLHRYQEPGHVSQGVIGQSTTLMTTWQFYAGPNVPLSVPFNSFGIVGTGGGTPYTCQVDAVCVAQY
jgi:hypothetical protein